MMSPKAPKDKIFEKVINPYLAGVLQHPQSIEMREGMLHIRDVEGPKKTGSTETRLHAMEQQVFKCQGMVERRLNANHMMITEFTNKHKIDANDIGKHLSRLYDRVDQLQAQIYDLQNQNCHRSGPELINPIIEPGEVLPNVIGINHVLVGELWDHHVVGVESRLHHPLALEDLLLHCFEPRLHISGLLRPSTTRMCNIPSRILID
ncbi:40S ribosomal protein S5-1 [Hordeum vulgare]|nr:40S ribosomal protein S5-1 [Hordeum vulgare]